MMTEEQRQKLSAKADQTNQAGVQYTAPNVPKMYCKFCGNVIDADSIVCAYCGNRVGTGQAMYSAPQWQTQQPQYVQQMAPNPSGSGQPVGAQTADSDAKKGDPLMTLLGYVIIFSVLALGICGVRKWMSSKGGVSLSDAVSRNEALTSDTAKNESLKDYYTVGETAEMDGVEYTLADAGIVPEEVYGYAKPDDGNTYVMFDFEIYNGSLADDTPALNCFLVIKPSSSSSRSPLVSIVLVIPGRSFFSCPNRTVS